MRFAGAIGLVTPQPNFSRSHLAWNQFTGSIPESIGSLTRLLVLCVVQAPFPAPIRLLITPSAQLPVPKLLVWVTANHDWEPLKLGGTVRLVVRLVSV